MKRNSLCIILILGLLISYPTSLLQGSEVLEQTETRVIVREHPKTGKLYVSIIPNNGPVPEDPFAKQRTIISRPDYRLLDPKVKLGEIPYDGPYSSSKKIYIFAASMATLGAVGTVGMVALPATAVTSGAAASGGGAYLAAGSAVAAGTAAGTVALQKSDSKKDDFILTSKSKTEENGENAPRGAN